MNEADIQVIGKKLDTIISLMVVGITSGKNQNEQIQALSAAGLQPKDIARFIDTTPNAVRVALFNLRKQKRRKKNEKK